MNFFLLINIFLFIFIYLSFKIKSKEISDSKFVLNINGNSHYLNYYYITLFLGEKKENQTYLLDTTSAVTTSPCSLCTSCGDHINDYFQLKSNLSIIKAESIDCFSLPSILDKEINNKDNDNCNFISDFDDESQISGFYTYNLIRFDSISSENNNEDNDKERISNEIEFILPIGCSMKETGGFQSRIADGVIGLNNNNKSFVSMMYNINLIKKNLFSLCLDEYGGYLSLGEIDSKYHIIPYISYVDFNSDNELYELEIKQIIVGSFEIKNKYKSIIDTSTTISYFPKEIFNKIMTGFFFDCIDKNEECGNIKRIEGYGICAEFNDLNNMNKAINNIWPIIKIEFNGYEYIWEPKNYYMNFSSSFKYKACIGFESDENMKNTIILGTNFMHGHDIIFDREKNRIGFVQAECGRKMNKKLNLINERKKLENKDKEFDLEKNKEIIINNKDIGNEEEIKENDENEEKKTKDDNKLNKNNNSNNINYLILLIFFIIFVIIIAIIIVSYQINNNVIDKKRYNQFIINRKNEEKNINKKPLGQIIEMVEDN